MKQKGWHILFFINWDVHLKKQKKEELNWNSKESHF